MRRFLTLKFVCLCAFVFFAAPAFTQKGPHVDVTRVTKVVFLSPGFSYEDRLGKFQTVYLTAYLATSAYYTYSSSLGTDSRIYFDPALLVRYRYYYNGAARETKGKGTERNSLNFIGPLFDITFSKAALTDHSYEEDNRRAIYTLGIAWGIQRNYKKRFSLDLSLGVGYFFAKGTEPDHNLQPIHVSQSGFTIPGNFSLGFWLNK